MIDFFSLQNDGHGTDSSLPLLPLMPPGASMKMSSLNSADIFPWLMYMHAFEPSYTSVRTSTSIYLSRKYFRAASRRIFAKFVFCVLCSSHSRYVWCRLQSMRTFAPKLTRVFWVRKLFELVYFCFAFFKKLVFFSIFGLALGSSVAEGRQYVVTFQAIMFFLG